MKAFYTPPQLAEIWSVKPAKIISWIRSGELQAINLASTSSSRPRYRIAREAIQLFEKRRSANPLPKRATVRKPKHVKEFFKD